MLLWHSNLLCKFHHWLVWISPNRIIIESHLFIRKNPHFVFIKKSKLLLVLWNACILFTYYTRTPYIILESIRDYPHEYQLWSFAKIRKVIIKQGWKIKWFNMFCYLQDVFEWNIFIICYSYLNNFYLYVYAWVAFIGKSRKFTQFL